jgi:hypothetical protein
MLHLISMYVRALTLVTRTNWYVVLFHFLTVLVRLYEYSASVLPTKKPPQKKLALTM